MKFIVYTDLHLAAKNPIHRVDNYSQSLISKLNEIYDISNKHSVDVILFLGDFFNTHRIYSYDLINQAIDIINSSDINTYSIIGQHDLIGYNKDSYFSSALCFLERHCKNFYTLIEPKEFDDTVIYPCHCYDDLLKTINQKVTKRKNSILLAHHLITEKRMPFHTFLTSELIPCPYSAVFFGDYHAGMEQNTIDNTMFWSPGSIARIAINETKKIPKIGIIETKLGNKINIEEIKLKSTKLAEEVFNVSIVETLKQHTEYNSDKLIQQIQEFELCSIDIYDLIEKAAKKNNIDKSLVDYILSKKPL